MSKGPIILSLSKDLSLSKGPIILSLSKDLSLSKGPIILSPSKGLLARQQGFDRLRANGRERG
ncbi:hypothetical protein FHT26_002914 [Rhizobacter sp. SG703]|nr:hypothetical protein [Rhizobacter sp. SG703]